VVDTQFVDGSTDELERRVDHLRSDSTRR
jgi:hypothetical protein